MKRLPILIAVLGLAACGTSVAKANILYNGDLDIVGAVGANGQNNPGPDGWVINAFKSVSGAFPDGADSETFCNVQQPGGYGLFYKPFQGTLGPPKDLLTVYFYQDNPATPGTKFTLSGYAACEANYTGLITTNSPPSATLFVVEFLNNAGSIIQSNAFDLIANGMPQAGSASMAQLTTPQYTAPANAVTVRAGAWMMNVYNNPLGGAQSFFVDAFDLQSVAAPGSPVITNQPAQATVALGATATFTVGVSNTTGVTYQWQLYNTNLLNAPGHISGATSQTLTITGVAPGDVGHYRVLVSNSSGSLYSADATLAIMNLAIDPVISLTGKIGDTYRIDYSTAVAPTTWIPLSTNKLATSPQLIVDTSPAASKNSRYYRAVFLH
jgi:hypothetical protein